MPPGVALPETVDTRFGTLHFTQGVPDKDSTRALYEPGVLDEMAGRVASVEPYFTGMNDRAKHKLKRFEFLTRFGGVHLFPTIEATVEDDMTTHAA